jgi:ubiquinol-cytochrome c reductase cytochrome b subunit
MSALRTAIVGLFLVQVATGVILMTAYSPSTAAAWGSVWYIQTQVGGGWWIRGIHHFASDAMLILLGIAIARCVWTKAYRAGGWRVWWSLLFAIGVVLAVSLTGHLLPWDQEGFWGTTVRTNILAKTPVVGETLRRLLLGGSELGQLTLTRFYTLHILILPAVLVLLFRFQNRDSMERPQSEHGAEPTPSRPPKPPLMGSAGALTLASVVLCVFLLTYFVCAVNGGTLLDAPADRMATDYPARPEWHTLFLFQWLKFFPGPTAEVVGAIVAPSFIVLILFLFPLLPKVLSPERTHRFVMCVSGILVFGAALLTGANLWHDRNPSDAAVAVVRTKQAAGDKLSKADEAVLRGRQFNTQRVQAARTAERALQLATSEGIPPEGPLTLLARDPQARGPRLFAANCASCHRFDGHNGLGEVPSEPPNASDLKGFASFDWIRRFLDNPMDDRYLGKTRTPEGEPAHTRMDRFVRERLEIADDAARAQVVAEYDAAASFLADQSGERRRPDDPGRDREEADAPGAIEKGREVFMTLCNECHSFDGERAGTTRAPEMKGYGSVEWLRLMIGEPDHDSRYRAAGRERARMPRFKEKLSGQEIDLLAQWIHEDR